MRTFIAIDLDHELKKNLSLLINRLNKGSKGIKWVSEEGMHLTLKFLGEISQEKVQDVENILKKISSMHKPFPLKLKGTGFFPPEKKNPRVLWVGIEEEPNLRDLQDRLERELEKLAFPREKRKFHPHLTLGRVKTPSKLEQTLLEIEKQRESNFGEMTVKNVTFFQSSLKPSGARYTVLSEFELK
jgi:2'-5' RNA ligase